MPPMLQGLNTFLQLQQGAGANRAQAMGGIGGAQQQQPQSLVPPMQPVDIVGAFETGKAAAEYARGGAVKGYDGGGPVEQPQYEGDGTGSGDLSPALVELTRRIMSGTTDDSPTSEDKGLALAQAGFSIAGGQSPFALSNIGAGASSGIDMLQKLKQQRAVSRMKQEQMQQAGLLRVEGLRQAKTAQADRVAAQAAELDRKKTADLALAQAKSEHEDTVRAQLEVKKSTDAALVQAAKDRADALAESRYQSQSHARTEDYYKTGQWRKLPGDDDHGVDGAPSSGGYEGPLVTSPNISVKQKQALEVAKPKVTQATNTVTMNLEHGSQALEDLLKHPGLSGAVGFRSGQDMVPGTDAASFKNDLNSVLSQQFAQAIQSMREASKTGGAVGNVSDREGEKFETMVAGLSRNQSEESFIKNAKRVIDYSKTLKSSWLDNYNQTYGELKPITPVPGVAGVAPPADVAPPSGMATSPASNGLGASDIDLINKPRSKPNVGPTI